MKPEYKKILHGRQTLDKARWDLGDALVAECGAPDPTSPGYGGPGKLRAVWNYMWEMDTTAPLRIYPGCGV
jgi:hypothetical protein